MPVQHDERALAEVLYRALEEAESVTPVQRVSKAERVEPVIPEAIKGELVMLQRKHDDVFWVDQKASRLNMLTLHLFVGSTRLACQKHDTDITI